ncbi:hypothetical protein K7711_22755 [Nocardia sp. CA2R105]|uniref:hypothetical protein n=1 Tax=Nocardia coffeae TaxID=2873381 RepID=UPI001CA6B61C|nr:hypothetical protein [Nocardia coffeae]MBY8859308.1 hypothetical protein [Nocardia coffeae]
MWADLGRLPQLVRQSRERRRAGGAPAADFTLTMRWQPGSAASAPGPYMFSLTQFSPSRATDVPAIWLAATSLATQLVRLDDAVGVTTYIRPARARQIGSLSVWADPAGLEAFMRLPDHIEIMNKYRSRGLPVRSATWWSGDLDPDAEVLHGLRLLDTHDTQRVTLDRA